MIWLIAYFLRTLLPEGFEVRNHTDLHVLEVLSKNTSVHDAPKRSGPCSPRDVQGPSALVVQLLLEKISLVRDELLVVQPNPPKTDPTCL